MKVLLILVSLLTQLSINNPQEKSTSFYDFKMKTIDGKDFDFAQLKGKRVMIVNTASECGYTPQYQQLEELYKTYGGDKFVILGFPANNFGHQEPGTDAEIKTFCTKTYSVTFPMFSKISVKGDDIAPLYKWLCNISMNGVSNATVQWNFNKFLIDENGHWISWHPSKATPQDVDIINWVKGGK
jgi:glutathione peroxidase